MNWLRPDYPYADVRVSGPHGDEAAGRLDARVTTHTQNDEVRTILTLTNISDAPYFTAVGDVGITLPLQDRYDLGAEQATQRCTAHLFCAGTCSYVLALRMGGAPPHLGLVLTAGELAGYSIERDLAHQSNDRGCFVLHPAPLALAPGEHSTIAWTIFPCAGKDDFFAQAARRSRFVRVECSHYVLFRGATATMRITPSFAADRVSLDGSPARPEPDGSYSVGLEATDVGERTMFVRADDRTLTTRILVKESLPVLLERRCTFIAARQQYGGPIERLAGALLAYDNEDDRVFYSPVNDYNAGRERVGMGVLLADYLSALRDGVVTASGPSTEPLVRRALDRYADFVARELVDETSGTVFNDAGRNGSVRRLYNAPWFATFYLARYRLDGDRRLALIAHRIVRAFYADGGADFYPLELPVLDLCATLRIEGLAGELAEATGLFTRHARAIAATGTSYPPHEVNYEQSIVAPAADILLQTHLLSGESELLSAARAQLRVLDQFHGVQPDHHLNDVAVRHWDGYWFGKRQRYGDTFPHYWSGLTGNVHALYARATGDAGSRERADGLIRGVLPLIHDDGRATCAYLFPHRVNGERGDYADPLANDQDWALVFALRLLRTR